MSPEQRRANVESFEYVWKTVRDKHWDPTLGGVAWQKVHDELLPRVEAAKTMEQEREVVQSMLNRLHQTHFGLIPAEAYDPAPESGAQGEPGVTGIDLRILNGHAIVTAVEPDSTAHDASVKNGWEITRIGKTEVVPWIAQLKGVANPSRMLAAKLDGGVDSEIAVDFSDINGKHISKKLARRVEAGELAQFGYLPPMAVRFEARKIAGGAEYIRFNLFLRPDLIMTKFGAAVHDCGQCPGVIIDLRGNPGGLGAMAMGMAGYFISKPDQKLGTMYMRTLPIRFVIFPRADVYEGKVAILVDSSTASTSEIFAGGMQDLKRARVFGERTAGAALPSQIERLPNGDGFQYAVANYISESGRQLEGSGVIPDVEVPLDRRELAEGRDAALEAALEWLRGKQ